MKDKIRDIWQSLTGPLDRHCQKIKPKRLSQDLVKKGK